MDGLDLLTDRDLCRVRKAKVEREALEATIVGNGTDVNPKLGKAPYTPTAEARAVASALATYNTPKRQIALYLGISPNTLDKYHSEDMEIGKVELTARAATKLVSKGLNGDSKCLQFFLECVGGWKKAGDEVSETAKAEMMAELQKVRNEMDQKHRKDF